jgi:hypothetical protein
VRLLEAMEMKPGRSFVRKGAAGSGGSGGGGYIQAKGVRPGSHGVSLVSSGLDDLDHILFLAAYVQLFSRILNPKS